LRARWSFRGGGRKLYQRFPLYLTVHPRGRCKVPLATLLVGIEDDVHEMVKCRDESACAAASSRQAFYDRERELRMLPRFRILQAAIELFAIAYVDCTVICITPRRAALHFISPSPHIASFRYPELSSSALHPSSGIKWLCNLYSSLQKNHPY
jgi:hypothetical protein